MPNPAEKPEQPRFPELVILADDLTGALDSGVEFANVGLNTIVATAPEHLEAGLAKQPDILVINTASREISPNQAYELHHALRKRLDLLGAPRYFKKVDSRLKGNIVPELNGLLVDETTPVHVAPAIPDMGRIHKNGILNGAGIAQPISISETLRGLKAPVFAPDICKQGDFDLLLDHLPDNAMLAGAKGLARSVAARMRKPAASGNSSAAGISGGAGTIMAAIGSRDEITLRQIDSLLVNQPKGLSLVQAPNGFFPEQINKNDKSLLLQLSSGSRKEDSGVVGKRFVAKAAHLYEEIQTDNLFCCGGQTAQEMLVQLSIATLQIAGELFPGVPISLAEFDNGRTFSLITKSGGFGDPDLLANLFNMD